MIYGLLGLRTRAKRKEDNGTGLERPTEEGNSPVSEILISRRVSRVPQDTRNPVGNRGDHPPRLNTVGDR